MCPAVHTIPMMMYILLLFTCCHKSLGLHRPYVSMCLSIYVFQMLPYVTVYIFHMLPCLTIYAIQMLSYALQSYIFLKLPCALMLKCFTSCHMSYGLYLWQVAIFPRVCMFHKLPWTQNVHIFLYALWFMFHTLPCNFQLISFTSCHIHWCLHLSRVAVCPTVCIIHN